MKQIIMTSPANLTGENVVRTISQWSEVRNAFLDAGIDVIVMPELPSGNLFIAQEGLIYKNDFIESRSKYAQRMDDICFTSRWFKEHRFDSRPDTSFNFNACDAVMSSDKRHLWFGFRSVENDLFVKAMLDNIFDEHEEVIVRPLLMRTSKPLNEVFCPLASGELMWYPDAFDLHSQMQIESWYEGRLIEVDDVDVERFVCNAVSVRDTIIMPRASVSLSTSLMIRGYDVVQLDVSELIARGGGIKSLTIELVE